MSADPKAQPLTDVTEPQMGPGTTPMSPDIKLGQSTQAQGSSEPTKPLVNPNASTETSLSMSLLSRSGSEGGGDNLSPRSVSSSTSSSSDKKPFNLTLWIVFTIFVTFRAADRIFLKDVQNGLRRSSYNLIYANVIWPILIQLITLCMITGYVLYQRYVNNDYTYDASFFMPGNVKASSRGAVPMIQLALFSFGDQLNAAIQAPPAPYVTLPVQSVLTNMVLVYTAIIAYFWIKTRYEQVHVIGIILIMVAILVQLGPSVSNNDCSDNGLKEGKCFASYKNTQGEFIRLQESAMICWYSLFGLSFVPNAFGNVYKQKVLQNSDCDVWYATWWSGNFQIMWGLMCIPMMWIPLPGQPEVHAKDFFRDLFDTLSCLGGNVPRPGDETCQTHPAPWVFAIFYFTFNLSFNVCLLFLTKSMSANWAQIATVLCLNLCSFFSQFKFLMGDAAQPMRYVDYMALLLASIALWIYNLEQETTPVPLDLQEQRELDPYTGEKVNLVEMPKRSQLSMLTASVCADGGMGTKGLIASSFEADNGGRGKSAMRIGSTIRVDAGGDEGLSYRRKSGHGKGESQI